MWYVSFISMMQELHIRKSWPESHKRDIAAKFSPHKCTILQHSTSVLKQRMFKYPFQQKAYLEVIALFESSRPLLIYIFYECNNTLNFQQNFLHKERKRKTHMYFGEMQPQNNKSGKNNN